MRMTDPSLLKAFVEHHGLPFGTSTMAKGMIDEDHVLSFGCIERARRQIQREFIRSADLVIGLGFDTIEVEYEAWVGSVPVLSIDIEDPDVTESVTVAGTVTGDITDSLTRMLAMSAHTNEWTDDDIAAHRDGFNAALRPKVENFSPHEALDVVRAVVPHDGIITYDVGAHTHQIASQWVTHAPRACHVTRKCNV